MKSIRLQFFIALILIINLAQAAPASASATIAPATPTTSQPVKLAGASDLTQQWMALEQQKLSLEQQLLLINRQQFSLLQQHLALKQAAQIDLHWQPAQDGAFPKDAIVGGLSNNQTLYICHAKFLDKGVHPGQLGKTGCIISYAGQSLVEKNYDVLAGKQAVTWKPSNTVTDDVINPGPILMPLTPPNSNVIVNPIQPMATSYPVIGGYEDQQQLLICRTIYGNEIHIGKVVSGNCNISDQNIEVPESTYEVLFVK